ncbi:hypothetical protein Ancab_011652 [Ancistrocladus abbreviatus]
MFPVLPRAKVQWRSLHPSAANLCLSLPSPATEFPSGITLLLAVRVFGIAADRAFFGRRKFFDFWKPCMKEMITFLNCLALNHNNDEKCGRQKELLGACMDAQSRKNKQAFGSINYHLQRLSRGRK